MRASWLLLCLTGMITLHSISHAEGVGQTRIATWKDDKVAAFALMFDDSMSIHLKNVVPELKKRNLVGTFYVNPGSGQYKANKKAWEVDVPAAGGVLANHTFTHKGAVDEENLDSEIKQANDAIQAALGPKTPTLISFGIPGVAKGMWQVTRAQIDEKLKKYNLLLRPETGGHFALTPLKNGKEMIARVDKALETKGFDFVAFHGVGGEWLSIDSVHFIELIDDLVARREKLWITDTISAQKYQTERESAEVKVESAGDKEIKLSVQTKADTKLYDQPLTLITGVPASWKKCEVTQGTTKSTVDVKDGKAMYEALPNGVAVSLKGS